MPSPLEQLLSADDMRDVGMAQLKQRMLMQLLLQNPVNEGDTDRTSPEYTYGTRIRNLMPSTKDPGMARNRDLAPAFSPIADKPGAEEDPRAAALEQLRKAMADRHEAWLTEHMATQGRRAQDISDLSQPPRPRVGPYPPATLVDLLKGR